MVRNRKPGKKTKLYFEKDEVLRMRAFLVILAADADAAAERLMGMETRSPELKDMTGVKYWRNVIGGLSWAESRLTDGIDPEKFERAITIVLGTAKELKRTGA